MSRSMASRIPPRAGARFRWASSVGLLALGMAVPACAAPTDEPEPESDGASAPTLPTSRATDEGGAVDDGLPTPPPAPVVEVPVRTKNGGIRKVSAELRNGVAYYQGDIDLGDPNEMKPLGNGLNDLDLRWPNARVPYVFDGLSGTDRTTIRNAMREIELRTRIRFEERSSTTCFEDIIMIEASTDEDVSSSKVGRQGGCQKLKFFPGHSRRVAIHELLHALGLKHEQARPDRDAFVQIHWQNIESGRAGNFEAVDDEDALDEQSPYDFNSIMHYGREQFCRKEVVWTTMPPTVRCVGPTITAWSNPSRNFGGSNLSPRDIDILTIMYGTPLGANETGDQMGTSIAIADFDDDGRTDVVIGAPGERVGSGPRSGALFAFKGTGPDAMPWEVLTESSPRDDGTTIAGAEEDDQFGAAMTVSDFDSDGFPDLAVGAPNKAWGAGARSGGVMIFRGSATGLVPWTFITISHLGKTGVAGDRFGAALDTIDIGGSRHLVVGAPGRAGGGAVYVVYMGSIISGQARPHGVLTPFNSTSTGKFGASLAVGDFDGDGNADIVAGEPGAGSPTRGAVTLFRGNGTRDLSRYQIMYSPDGAAGDEFGFAVEPSNVVTTNGRNELVVGAPGKKQGNVRTGAAFVYEWRSNGGLAGFVPIQEIFPGSTTDPQRFGHAFTSARLLGGDTSVELVVGAPNFDGSRGRVVIMSPSNGQYTTVRAIGGPTPLMPAPRFGSALAVGTVRVEYPPLFGDMAADPDLFVGAPAASIAASFTTSGAVYGYNNTANGSYLKTTLHQGKRSPFMSSGN